MSRQFAGTGEENAEDLSKLPVVSQLRLLATIVIAIGIVAAPIAFVIHADSRSIMDARENVIREWADTRYVKQEIYAIKQEILERQIATMREDMAKSQAEAKAARERIEAAIDRLQNTLDRQSPKK